MSTPGNTGGHVQVGVGPGVDDDDVRPLRGGEGGRGAGAGAVLGGRRLRPATGAEVDAEPVARPLGGVVQAELPRQAEEGAQLRPRA